MACSRQVHSRCSDTPHAKGFQCQARKFQCKICHKFCHFTSVCLPKKSKANTPSKLDFQCKETESTTITWRGHFTPSKMQGAVNMIQTQKRNSAYKWRYTEPVYHTRTVLKPVYLMANLAYHAFKSTTPWNQYLRARLDTCAPMWI